MSTDGGYGTRDMELHQALVVLLHEFHHAHAKKRSWDHIHMWAVRIERLVERGPDPVDDLLQEAGMAPPREGLRLLPDDEPAEDTEEEWPF